MVTGQVWGSPRKSSQQARAARHRAEHRHACEMAPARNRTESGSEAELPAARFPRRQGLGWAEQNLWTTGKGYVGGGPRWGCTKQQRLAGPCRARAYTMYLSHQHFNSNSEATLLNNNSEMRFTVWCLLPGNILRLFLVHLNTQKSAQSISELLNHKCSKADVPFNNTGTLL